MNLPIRFPFLLFALAMVIFGVQHFIYGDFLTTLLPVPLWFPARTVAAYLFGAILTISAVSIAVARKTRLYFLLLGILFLFLFLLLHIPKLITHPYDGGEWTGAFELLGMGGGALFLSSIAKKPTVDNFEIFDKWWIPVAGVYLFAVSLIIFGIQHFIYADFVATMVPGWIPAHLFWAYFTGISLLGGAVSIIFNTKLKYISPLMGMMFLLWALLLHLPMIMANPSERYNWSVFVTLAMSATSFGLTRGTGLKHIK